MAKLNYYLNFPGNSEKAFNLYQFVLGGEIIMTQKFKDIPGNEGMSAEDGEKIMHMTMVLPNGDKLMATDVMESMGQKYIAGNNYYLSFDCESKEECDKIYKGLSEGGKIEMELQDTFWGAYFGMWTDRFDIQWIVNYDYPQESN